MRSLLATVWVVAALPAAGVAAGMDPAEILITGTRLEVAPDGLPATVTVLDRAAIDAAGDAAVPDLLRRVPGLQISQPGAGGVTQVFLRGSEPNFVVVLLDGIRVNDPNNTRGGSFDLASINPADLERIEIVRGPQSSIYGSDALAGVIHLISRAPTSALSAAGTAEVGGDEYSRLSGRVSGPLGRGQGSLALTRRDDGSAVAGSRYETDTLTGRWRWSDGGRSGGVNVALSDSNASSFPEQSGGPERAVLRTLDERSARDFVLGAELRQPLTDELALIGRLTRFDRSDRYDSPGIDPGDAIPPNGARNDLERDNAGLRLAYQGASEWQGSVGIDAERESGASRGYVVFAPDVRIPADFALERDTVGVFIEGRWQARKTLALQASARHDAPDSAANETTGQLGGVWSVNGGDTEFRANVGRGFKLPSFFALGSPLIGEPNLRPEQSRSVDLGVRQQLGAGASLDVVVFDNDYEDLIDFDPDTFRSVNRDRVTTRGVEAAFEAQLQSTLSARLHATYTDIEVKGADRELLQRPEWSGGAGLRWQPREAWLLDLDWAYVGATLDNWVVAGESVSGRLGDYRRFDLNLSWQATPQLGLSFAVDNVLDASYEEAIGFPSPGLRPRLAVTYRYGD